VIRFAAQQSYLKSMTMDHSKPIVGRFILLFFSVLIGVSLSTSHFREQNRVLLADEPDFETAKTELQKVLSLIHNRYELGGGVGNNFFLASNNIGKSSWEVLRYKFAHKIVSKDASFLMVFGGSSVTAGHDNYYNQSYPFIFERRMKGIFSTLGIALTVRDIALGANNCAPYILCYESMGGSDPDFLGWEQSYNCGRDEGIFETAARMASLSSNKALLYFSASGAWSPTECEESKDSPPFSSEEWTPAAAGLDEWKPIQADVETEKDLLFKFNQANPSCSRFCRVFQNEYVGVVAHGFNVWENNKECKPNNCNGIDAAQHCLLRFMTKDATEYGSGKPGAKWHPTRAFHMLRGEALAWLYALAMLDSVYMIVEDLKKRPEGSTADSLKQLSIDYAKKLEELQPPLPHPKKCGELYKCAKKPLCYTDFRPHFSSNMTLSELVVGETAWTYDPQYDSDWTVKYGYLDAKPEYSSKGSEQGEIHIKVTIGETNHLWLCGTAANSHTHSTVHVDLNPQFTEARVGESGETQQEQDQSEPARTINGVPISMIPATSKLGYTPSADRVPWKHMKYVGFECKNIHSLPTGTHVISISSEQYSQITHVVMWP
jgi:hypothetical protein